MKHLVIGHGEIGQAVGENLISYEWCDIKQPPMSKKYDVLHVCFPYDEEFIQHVKTYAESLEPNLIIIYSTVAIGTTKQIPLAVHSPVEGKHPELAMSMRFMERWIGANDKELGFHAREIFRKMGISTRIVNSSDYTEALKLLSTSKYGINLVWADYENEVAQKVGMNYDLVKEFTQDYNKLYQNLGMGKRFQKFVLDPPNGKIGGHCVVPNAKLLNDYLPADMLDDIGAME